ncbi:hypothetical protein ACVCAH_33365 [Micromonospora sp. LZ34]
MSDRALTWTISGGMVQLDRATGAPVQFCYSAAPDRRYLLDGGLDIWHSAEHRWGAGFLVTDVGTWRWNRPDALELDEGHSVARHRLGDALELVVSRAAGDRLRETHTLHNLGRDPVTITSWGIVTPFRDVYDDAATALTRGVHAHVWTGGARSWVAAVPMDGGEGVLTLQLAEGRLDAYSIESRNTYSSSNVRGHIVLHPTDLARNPGAFGGQAAIVVPAAGSHRLAWEVGFDRTVDDFAARVRPDAAADRYAVAVGGRLALHTGSEPIVVREPDLARVVRDGDADLLEGSRHGVVHVDVGDARIAVLVHEPLEQLVRARVAYILTRQRAAERGGPSAAAFVPVDRRTDLTQTVNGWPDWSDGAERLAMPTLLQEALRRGWCDEAATGDALAGWAVFARECLVDDTGPPRWGSVSWVTKPRLYNAPWLAHFFAQQHRLLGSADDLELAARILERSYELGAGSHLSIGQPEAVVLVGSMLDAAGQPGRADALRDRLRATAKHFASVGRDLPSHEVNYEQSMVAPLLSLFATVRALDGSGYDAELAETVRWLRAFAGRQPHARMHHVPIRHWDGYWFGRDRQWGDVFPHHWTVLNAVALSQLPEPHRSEGTRTEADAVFTANLASFHPDGSATCAFVMPSTVDGRPAYREDPLVNDQDWALTLWLRTMRS